MNSKNTIGKSSNGRTLAFDSSDLGSNPSFPSKSVDWRSKPRKKRWTEASLRDAIKQSYNIESVLKILGLRVAGGNYKTMKNAVSKFNIDISHFSKDVQYRGFRAQVKATKLSNEEIFCVNSKATRTTLKKAILKQLLIEYICPCGQRNSHNGKPLVLQIDHINGVYDDNRLDNLRWLCPNCHSQTDTFAGRNKGCLK